MNERHQHRNEFTRNGGRSRDDEQNFRNAGRDVYGDDRASFAEAGAGYWDDRGSGADWQDERPERTARYSNPQERPWTREPGRIGQYQGSAPQYGGYGSSGSQWSNQGNQGGYGGYYDRSQHYNQYPYGRNHENQYASSLNYGGNYRPGRFGSSYGNYGSGSVYGTSQGGYGGGYGIEAGGPYTQQRSRNLNQHAGRGPKGYQRSDERLREVISERLTEAPHIDASEITVTVKNGAVTLEGTVDERWIRHEVENLVEACGGVKDISNNLRVMSSRTQSASREMSDEDSNDALLSGSPRSTRKN